MHGHCCMLLPSSVLGPAALRCPAWVLWHDAAALRVGGVGLHTQYVPAVVVCTDAMHCVHATFYWVLCAAAFRGARCRTLCCTLPLSTGRTEDVDMVRCRTWYCALPHSLLHAAVLRVVRCNTERCRCRTPCCTLPHSMLCTSALRVARCRTSCCTLRGIATERRVGSCCAALFCMGAVA